MNINYNPFYQPTPEFERLYIFGAGGFGRELAWLAEQSWGSQVELTFLVDQPEYLSTSVNGLPTQLLADTHATNKDRFVVAIGDPALRQRKVQECLNNGLLPIIALVHPRAEVSRWVDIGEGTIICAGSIITTNIVIGNHVHINLDCTVGHDVNIGDHVTLSPGVHVSGNVVIGNNVFIGTGASIINGQNNAPLVIGEHSIVAAGACVTKAVEPGALVAGVPAIRKR